LAEGCKAEVYDFNHVSLIFNEYIVKFNIPMSNSFLVKVVKCVCNLFEEPSTYILLNLPIIALLLNVLM